MAKYTRQELKNAFCVATKWSADTGKTKSEWLTEWVAKKNLGRDEFIASFPPGVVQAKNLAVAELVKQIQEENNDSTL